MTTRWEVEDAVFSSNIEPTGRFILIALLAKAGSSTAEVAEKYAPTFDELATRTGYSRSTVAEWMKALTEGKWIERDVPSARAKSGYILAIGDPNVERPSRSSRRATAKPGPPGGPEPAESEPTHNAAGTTESTPDPAPPGPPGGSSWSAERTSASPPSGPGGDAPIRNSPTESSSTNQTFNPPPAADESRDGPPSKPRKRSPKKAKPYREDVEQICGRLAEWVIRNGSKAPDVTDEWRRDARLLLDEKRTPQPTLEKVLALIDWCQEDTFWRGNIRSMPTFRKQYDAVRLKALDEWRKKAGGNGSGYVAKKVNHDDPNHHANAWAERKRRAQQQ